MGLYIVRDSNWVVGLSCMQFAALGFKDFGTWLEKPHKGSGLWLS